MNLTNIYSTVEGIALSKINVNSFYKGSPYTFWQTRSVDYASVCFTVENVRNEENTYVMQCLIYFGDRLENDGSNWLQIQNDAANILPDIINDIRDADGVVDVYGDWQLEFFNQRMSDYLAGGYVEFQIEVVKDTCEDYSE